MSISAQLHHQSSIRRRREIGGHHRHSAAKITKRRRHHPFIFDLDQSRHAPSHRAPQQNKWRSVSGFRRELRVLLSSALFAPLLAKCMSFFRVCPLHIRTIQPPPSAMQAHYNFNAVDILNRNPCAPQSASRKDFRTEQPTRNRSRDTVEPRVGRSALRRPGRHPGQVRYLPRFFVPSHAQTPSQSLSDSRMVDPRR